MKFSQKNQRGAGYLALLIKTKQNKTYSEDVRIKLLILN